MPKALAPSAESRRFPGTRPPLAAARPASVAERGPGEAIESRLRVLGQKTLFDSIGKSPRVLQQKAFFGSFQGSFRDELLQGPFATAQPTQAHDGENSAALQITRNSNGVQPVQLVRPGDPVPTPEKQLTYRLRAMADKAEITPLKIHKRMLRQITQLPSPPLPAPNQNLSEQDKENIVTAGIRRHAVEDLKKLEELKRSKRNPYLPEVDDYEPDIFEFKVKSQKQSLNILEDLQQDVALTAPTVIPAVHARIDRHLEIAEHATYTDADQNDDPELRSAMENVAPGPNLFERAAAKRVHDRGPSTMRELSNAERKAMSAALKEMPTVTKMLKGSLGAGVEPEDLDSPLFSVEPKMDEADDLLERVQLALAKLADLVEPAKRIPKEHMPSLSINPDPESDFFDRIRMVKKKFRAGAHREGERIYVSNLTEIRTLVHEYGHNVEYYLPIDDWLDIQELLRIRHSGNQLVPIYPKASDEKTRNEAAYNAKMPATGLYSAKVYDSDSTEVMSMTLEYFSSPETAKKMIDEDPLQSAVILRSVRPDEFHRHVPQELRDVLPSTGTSRLAERKERERQIQEQAEEERQIRLKFITERRGGVITSTEGNVSIGDADL